MKIGKWILGLLAGIGGLLAIILGMKNGQSKRQFNKAVKENKKKDNESDNPLRQENIYSCSPICQKKSNISILDDSNVTS